MSVCVPAPPTSAGSYYLSCSSPFGDACLSKDTVAWLVYMRGRGLPAEPIGAIHEVNDALKERTR